MNIIIFGPPGAGKGTQAQRIAEKLNLHKISTGEILRNEVTKKSEIGKEIEHIISKGDFATDDIVNRLIKKTICNPKYRNRIIFDGYPRNITQAENLETILNSDNQSLNFILYLSVSRDIVEERILKRITCEKCNKTFNELNDEKDINTHKCGKKYLKKRNDDNQETIITRFDEYMKKTKPVLDFYSNRAIFFEINGNNQIEEISSKIEQILAV